MGLASVRLHPYCTGLALKCMHDIVGDIEGEGGVAHVIPRLDENVLDMEEEEDWEDEKKRLAQEGMVCLPRCSLQQNVMQTSSAM